ncbi:hypothetical protein ARAM_003646 [Aspergillus rambellii]|uniref:Uncharacterized protein n=1 Tax=Aspergillus rambellii TaxID=308745 RepID=A0A0F8VUL8_9EURO|nr:hypothetical protein ARAM_003646 [Aspergillus rambellii]
MPTPANPNNPSNRGGSTKSSPTKQKPLDIGQPLGIYDTNSVRAKVRKWQQHGGGVITADEVIYYEDEEENNSTAESKSKPANDKKSSNTISAATTRNRSKSTPRKRVISDEHWKLNRTPTQAPTAKLPAPRRIAEYTTNDSVQSPRSSKSEISKETNIPSLSSPHGREGDKVHATTTTTTTTTPLALRERRKSRSSHDIDSIIEKIEKEHASYSKSSKPSSRPTTAEKNRSSVLSEPSESPQKKDSVLDDDSEWATSEADFSELSRRRARGTNHGSKARTPLKPPKGGIFGQMLDESRKMFSKPEPPKQPAQSRGSKIETWLSNTHDPFLDDKEPDVEIPAPLKTRGNRNKQTPSKTEGKDAKGNHPSSPEHSGRHPRERRPRSRNDKPNVTTSSRDASPSPQRRKSSEHKQSNASSITKEDPTCKAVDGKEGVPDTETYSFSGESEVSGNNPPVPLVRKRPFPSTGVRRLSTIASVESMSTHDDEPSQITSSNVAVEKPGSPPEGRAEAEERDQFDPNSLSLVSAQVMKRLTTHDDLISVLSSATTRSRSIRSARSLRGSRNRNATVTDILRELALDEEKYMRELKTLVGGVIPVLLTCVLSRSDSAVAAGLFHPSADPKDELNFTKPIVNMGVAIERLKLLHKRIPHDNTDSLLQWAHGAEKVYHEYLKAWRLGFKDVVVNLAPLEEGEESNNADSRSLDEGMSRDEQGDVVDSSGQKVDVAYLLKRPLVRLKYLAKSFKGISMLQPSPKAEEVAMNYQNLVAEARRRARDERARLEDESASVIDSTRARDPESLGTLTGVTIDKARRVRARDFFNLSIYHSTGQVIDCRAELLLRDNIPENGPGGDLLICEIDHSDRWLLFPPMDLGCISARKGDKKGEIVVMVRSAPGRKHFQELLLLRIDEEEVGFEWIQLLGLNPVPPAIYRSQSFIERAKQRQRAQTVSSPNEVSTAHQAPPSPSNIAIPIGEKPTTKASRRSWNPQEQWSDPGTAESSTATESQLSLNTAITRDSDYASPEPEAPSKCSPQPPSTILHSRDPRKINAGDDKSSHGLKRSKAKRISRYGESSPQSPLLPPDAISDNPVSSASPRDSDSMNRLEQAEASAHREHKTPNEQQPKTPIRAEVEQSSPRVSSVPSMDLPSIPKLRQGSSHTYIPDLEPDEECDAFDYAELPETPTKTMARSGSGSDSGVASDNDPPQPPPHSRSPSSTSGSSLTNTPILSPTAARIKRRGSSPLKHEYEPSTASDSYSDSDTSTVRHYDMYSDSDTATDSSDEDSGDDLPLKPRADHPQVEGQKSDHSQASSTLSLSNSTRQAGYRSVPSQPSKSSTAMATVFVWSDKGSWESVLPDECKIIISPGLVEAYEMKDDPLGTNDDDTRSQTARPLVALELTPLVPIRRGTAIDISIRSPPTARSKVTWSNNIMLRSRSADECEILYGLINHSRINNPTYIALQNARGPLADLPAPLEPGVKNASGFFGWPRRRKSYRASSSPRSVADNSESSVGTMSSAFSALKRFGAGSKMFSISRSSVTSRGGAQKEDSLYSSSAASGSNHASSGGIGRMAGAINGVDGIGLSNAKIRLYIRETQSKWRDMGAARLTIMPASPSPEPRRPDTAGSRRSDASGTATEATETIGLGTDGNSPPASGAASPRRGIEQRKRILIRGKTRSEVLLDVCLDESCFERVARTGIAVSVREENENGAMPQKGGVTGGCSTVYMIQMKGEAEAAYTFGLVGKVKY